MAVVKSVGFTLDGTAVCSAGSDGASVSKPTHAPSASHQSRHVSHGAAEHAESPPPHEIDPAPIDAYSNLSAAPVAAASIHSAIIAGAISAGAPPVPADGYVVAVAHVP